jgi:Fe-S cluster assembly protein SufD
MKMNAIETKPKFAVKNRRDSNEPAWLSETRQQALVRFTELGLPTTRDEDWRFTNVAPLKSFSFEPAAKFAHNITANDLKQFPFTSFGGARLVFVDGFFAPELSVVPQLPKGVKVMSLADAFTSETELVRKFLFRHATIEKNAFAALNTAHFQDGAFIYLSPNTDLESPIHLLFVSTGKTNGTTTHPRNLIVAERGSHFCILETYASLGDAATFTNSVTELIAGENVSGHHMKFQDENPHTFHIGNLAAHFGRSSNVSTHSFALGAKLSRTNIHANLAGEGLECILNGLYLTRGEQLADHHMIVEHAQPHCASHEYFNGILADKSKGVFHGRIFVHPNAQKTDAKQTNKNLLLSDDATTDTKPQLEIYADDVKCTHGATIGQLNDEAIFYLRARGIPLKKAKRILVHAFAGEIIERVGCGSVREELDRIIWDRLENNSVPAKS